VLRARALHARSAQRATRSSVCHRGFHARASRVASEDAKSLSGALDKYRRAVEASVEGGLLELGLKGFSAALINVASRDSVKARAFVCVFAVRVFRLLACERCCCCTLHVACVRARAGGTRPRVRVLRARARKPS
jgi:hypothetical protein